MQRKWAFTDPETRNLEAASGGNRLGRGEEEVGITLLGVLNERQESRLFVWVAGSLLEDKNRNFLRMIR